MDKPLESCENCRSVTYEQPYSFRLDDSTTCFTAYVYAGVVRKAILNYKYKSRGQCARSFVRSYLRVIDYFKLERQYDIFTAVPSNKSTQQHRFDQVKRIAQPTARAAGTLYKQLMRPTRKTAYQHSLSMEMRSENAKGLYAVISTQEVADKRILVFDDVVTTGSTLKECARVLLEAGAAKVDCIALARTKKSDDLSGQL